MKTLRHTCQKIASSPRFQNFILIIILLNALVIGLETYQSITDSEGQLLTTLNAVFLGVFTVEIIIRFIAEVDHPLRFFKRGWNVFDFLVVTVAYLPFVQSSATLLRLARLLRVARLLEVIPGLRVVIDGIGRSIKPVGGLAGLTFFILYVYGVIGWILFHAGDPYHWGNIGKALLTLFQLLTLEGWNEVLAEAMKISSWSWIYFVSFILIATFVVFNIVIAVVINSMDEARAAEAKRLRAEEFNQTGEVDPTHQIETVREALDELEARLEHMRKRWSQQIE